jgi:hypothetical protein
MFTLTIALHEDYRAIMARYVAYLNHQLADECRRIVHHGRRCARLHARRMGIHYGASDA